MPYGEVGSYPLRRVEAHKADRSSDGLVQLQLGCWLIYLRLLPDVRILPKEKDVGTARHEEGCRSD